MNRLRSEGHRFVIKDEVEDGWNVMTLEASVVKLGRRMKHLSSKAKEMKKNVEVLCATQEMQGRFQDGTEVLSVKEIVIGFSKEDRDERKKKCPANKIYRSKINAFARQYHEAAYDKEDMGEKKTDSRSNIQRAL